MKFSVLKFIIFLYLYHAIILSTKNFICLGEDQILENIAKIPKV